MLNLLFISSIFIFMFAMIKSLFEISIFLKQLKKVHTKEWESLGRPRWNIHFGEVSYRNTVKKIRENAFASLEDPILEECYKAIKRADRVGLITAIIAFSITLFQAIMS